MPQTNRSAGESARTARPERTFRPRDYALLITQLQEAALQARRRADDSPRISSREIARVYGKIAETREHTARRLLSRYISLGVTK